VRKTRLVIPCYNEALRLNPEAFLFALSNDSDLSFLFVNDGSTDNTVPLLEALKKKNPAQIEIMNLEKNAGKAEAVRRGVLASLEESFDNVGYWDADLATPLAEVKGFCDLLNRPDVDMAIGSRVCLLGHKIERRALKHYLGRLFATCASLLLEIGIYDTQCGAKMFANSAAVRQVFGKPFKVKWTFDVEMLARFSLVKREPLSGISSRWVELPLAEWIDVKGSKVTCMDYIKGGLEFCTLFYYLHTPARKGYEKYLAL